MVTPKHKSEKIDNTKEFNVWVGEGYPENTKVTLNSARVALENEDVIIHTTQTNLLNTKRFEEGYKIFVHTLDNECLELILGYENKCTNREIKMEHNLEKLFLANEFGYVFV